VNLRRIIYIIIFVIFVILVCLVAAYDLPKWFPFNQDNALSEWQEKVFRNRVIYEVEAQLDGGYLSAQSKDACSGLLYRIKFNPNKSPMISWFWKVIKFPDKGQEKAEKGGWLEKDDYAARVYVVFPNWNFMKIKCIEYIWDEGLPDGKIISSPYSGNIKLIVAESGRENLGQWIFEKRNIVEDYNKAFGRSRAPWVGAIAIMTDADNTLSSAEALYKNIKVGYRDE
jgi:hypothetical protein